MRPHWLLVSLMVLCVSDVQSQTQQETFSQYVRTLPAASTPLSGSELVWVYQGGVAKQVASSAFTGVNINFSSVSGDCTATISAVFTCTKTNGSGFGTFATQNFTTPPAIGGVTPAAGSFTNLGATGTISGNIASLNNTDQTLSGGANVTSFGIGTVSSGTTTVDCGKSPLQFFTNNGASTLAAPANDGSCIVLMINSASAGALSFSGFSVGSNTGDTLDTTNGHKFSISVWRINSTAGYTVSAHQ